MRRCAAKAQILSKCRIRHSSQSAYFDAVALKQTAGELDQAQVVLPMLVVTDQDRPALRQPCQRPLHHPAPCLATPGKPLLPAVLTDRPDVAVYPFSSVTSCPVGLSYPLSKLKCCSTSSGSGRSTTIASIVASNSC